MNGPLDDVKGGERTRSTKSETHRRRSACATERRDDCGGGERLLVGGRCAAHPFEGKRVRHPERLRRTENVSVPLGAMQQMAQESGMCFALGRWFNPRPTEVTRAQTRESKLQLAALATDIEAKGVLLVSIEIRLAKGVGRAKVGCIC
jgi:hypothetical protein